MNVTNQQVFLPVLQEKKVSLYIKREDQIHPYISGNKYRKLKYNLLEAKANGATSLLTFGGAYSNHIAATAYAGYKHNLNTIGVIRGEELALTWRKNSTLLRASENGMQFYFISRKAYRQKETLLFKEHLYTKFGPHYLLPEGGTNTLAVQGCEEILTNADAIFDVICCSVGTGGTIAGISNAASSHQTILGFPALKGDFLQKDIRNFAPNTNWKLVNNYHFGGYAKLKPELITFINTFRNKTNIPLDPIYTGKMLFGILDMVKKDIFKADTKILAIHSGGLQGIEGMNSMLKKKNLPLIDL